MIPTLILATLASMMTPQEQEKTCYSMADLTVAAIEARDAGVPISKTFELLHQMDDGSDVMKFVIKLFRDAIVSVYSDYPIRDTPLSKTERQKLINQYTAQCMVSMADTDSDPLKPPAH